VPWEAGGYLPLWGTRAERLAHRIPPNTLARLRGTGCSVGLAETETERAIIRGSHRAGASG
jgi:hypothetical protein